MILLKYIVLRIVNRSQQKINFITIRMDVIKDDYVVMITMFYKKAIKHHNKRRTLMEKFNGFLAENNKQRGNLSSSNRKALPRQNQYTKSSNNITEQTSKLTSNISSPQQLSKSQRCFKNENLLYTSTSLLKVMSFVFIYHLIQTDDFKQFQQVSNQIANYLVENSVFDQVTLKRVNFLWSNIGKFLTRRNPTRWVFQMKQSYNQFNEDFIRLIIYVMLKKKVAYQKIDNKFAQNPQFLKLMAKNMEITIVSFNINNNQIQNLTKIGQDPTQIPIGFQKDEKRYVFLDEVPIIKSSMNFQASQLNKKISKTIDSLLKDYKDNTEKLMGLNFLKQINTKESKIKKYLSIDS